MGELVEDAEFNEMQNFRKKFMLKNLSFRGFRDMEKFFGNSRRPRMQVKMKIKLCSVFFRYIRVSRPCAVYS